MAAADDFDDNTTDNDLPNNNEGGDPAGVIGVRSITNQQQIYSILAGVQKARTPITIKFEDNDKYYTSLILRTDLEGSYIIIDEVAPSDGHQLAIGKRPFSIRGSHQGVNLFFRPNVIAGSGIENNIAFYKVMLPAEMIYQQRRAAYRAPVARSLQVPVVLESRKLDIKLNGRLHDISISGCRINFDGEVEQELIRGELFDTCAIDLPTGFKIMCGMTLKHSRYEPEWRETTMGFQFESIDRISVKAIDRFVYFLQREARRLEAP